jgi:hypothetical protein
MYSGVGKSGSPAPKPITCSPFACNAFALESTAKVADSLIADKRFETRDLGCEDAAMAAMLTQWKEFVTVIFLAIYEH